MLSTHFPVLGLRLRTPRLELRPPAAGELAALASLAAEGISGAFVDNAASLAVSRKLGYRPDGLARHVVGGRLAVEQRLRLTRSGWRRHRLAGVTIEGLEPCLPLFGR